MKRANDSWRRLAAALSMAALLLVCVSAGAATIVLKDGRTIEGKLAQLTTISNKPQGARNAAAPNPRLIVLCDDGLRRYYVSKMQLAPNGVLEGDNASFEKFILKNQPAAEAGLRLASVGTLLRSTPFDEHGRRMVEMQTDRRPITVYLGITEITPTWSKVEGLRLPDSTSYTWEQRIATNSLPPELLSKILNHQIDPKKIDDRLKIVRLYLQMDRYQDAQAELERVIADFPEHAAQFARTEREAKQNAAKVMLKEVKLRREAGQHQLTMQWLNNFPHDGVAGEILQDVRRSLDAYNADFARGKEIIAKIDELMAAVEETKLRERIRPIRDEIVAELNFNTLGRMTAFEQAIDDEEMPVEEKLSLAVSGWLIGSDQSIRKLPVAISLFTVRNKVREYLEEPLKPNRDEILTGLASEEAATVDYVTHLIALMVPTRELPEADPAQQGHYKLTVNGLPDEPPINYRVQLPLEYDPHRVYPTIVTLHGAATTAEQQIDWWAGSPGPDGARIGQAGRYGYIVIAPEWGKEHQGRYGYSLSEHYAVLQSLRDACRHFSVDTDRVFLSGHAMGGEAAWDIGLAHPDLWAGIIPIVAVADRYTKFYWQEGKYVPIYTIVGGLDGDKLSRNTELYEKYLTHAGYNFTLAEFQGRGHEHFSDEILKLFDWMGRLSRDFARKNVTGYSMRSWDNFFWWVELNDLPPKTQVDPINWPPPPGTHAAETTASVNANNGIHVKTGADRVTVWLSPEIIDFKRRITISINGRSVRPADDIVPSLEVLLEDVRTRVARLHPFWAKVDSPGGQVNVADVSLAPAR